MEIFEMQKEFDELMKKGQELIEKMKKEQSKTKRWKPKAGETYYYIGATGSIDSLHWFEQSEDCASHRLYEIGNCFKTEKEAQKELDRRIAEKELLDLCDWESGELYSIYYIIAYNNFTITSYLTMTHSPYRFASRESAQNAIDTLGEDKLKLVFRIKD